MLYYCEYIASDFSSSLQKLKIVLILKNHSISSSYPVKVTHEPKGVHGQKIVSLSLASSVKMPGKR